MLPATFRLQIVSLVRVVFDGEVPMIHLIGDEGEYEVLPFHYPLLGALPQGEVMIADFGNIPIRSGVVLFESNTCTILIEEMEALERKKLGT
ncbi:MAG TPA: hypothetical protein PKL97_09520 [Candidatus Omnitrophota bacterium]|nr:hypothetical protein [Candidatus Omnitrophota bacterium]